MAGGLLTVAVLSGLYVEETRPDTVVPSDVWHWFLICVPPSLVAVQRLNPVVALAIAAVAQGAIWISNLPEVLLPIIVMLYIATSDAGTSGFRASVGSGIVLTLVTGAGVRVADDVSVYQLPLVILTCGTAIILGVYTRRQRVATGELATLVATAQAASEHERAQAIADERTRIGRELHDIIGHLLSVITVQAETRRPGSRSTTG